MKIFFDTNVYVAETLVGGAAKRMIEATRKAKWRIFTSRYLLDELSRVLVEDFNFSRRLAAQVVRRLIWRYASVEESRSKAAVPRDPKDSPILQAALDCGADFLVTNDRHLRELDPFHGLRILSMTDYYLYLQDRGLLK